MRAAQAVNKTAEATIATPNGLYMIFFLSFDLTSDKTIEQNTRPRPHLAAASVSTVNGRDAIAGCKLHACR